MNSEYEQTAVNYFTEESLGTMPQRWQKQMRPELSDVILINPHKTMNWIGEFQRRYPHIPVVSITSDEATVQTAYQKIEKIRQLPQKTIERLGQDTWLALIAYLWLEETQSFYLTLDGKHPTGCHYALDEIYQDLPRLLSSMEQLGLLTKTLANRAYQCKQCHSIKLLIREGCKSCHSDLVLEQPLIHHFDCAYQSIEQQFMTATSGTLQCPKCKGSLTQLGIDYDKPGAGYYCQACEQISSEASIQADCLNCHERFRPTEEHLSNLYHYHLSDQGIQYLFNKNETSNQLIHSISEFNQFYEAYQALAKASKLKSAIVTITLTTITLTTMPTPAEKIHLLLNIAQHLKQRLSPDQVLTFHWDTLYLLLPGMGVDEAERFIKQNLTEVDTIRFGILDIIDFSKVA